MQSKFDELVKDVMAPKYNDALDFILANYATRADLDQKAIDIGAGDMVKSTYDADGDGTVDNAKKLDGHTADYFAAAAAAQPAPILSSALPDSGTALTANAIYNIPASSPVGTYQFVAPSSGEAHGFFTTDTSVAITFGTGATYLGAALSFSASTAYEFDVLNNVWAFTEVVSA